MQSDEKRASGRTTTGVVLAIVFLLLLIPLGMLLSHFGGSLPLAARASDVCSSPAACDAGLVGTWSRVAAWGPWVAAAAGWIATLVLLLRRLLAFWVPVITAAVMICTVVAAYIVVILAMPA